jgi:hypothetical protein
MAAQTIQDSQGRPYEVVRLTSPQSLPGYKTIPAPDGSYIAVKPLYGQQQAQQQPSVDALSEWGKDAAKDYAKDYIKDYLTGPAESTSATSSTLSNPAAFSGAGLSSSSGASTAFSSGGSYAGQAVGSAPGGGTLMSTGATIPASEGAALASNGTSSAASSAAPTVFGSELAAQGLGAAGVAAGGYNAYRGIKSGNKTQSALGGASMGLGLNAMGYALGPYGWAAMLAAPVIASTFNHESTRDVAKRRTEELMGKSDDPQYKNYVQAMREQYNSAPVNPDKPFAGKYRNFGEYERAGLEAQDLSGVFGNLKLGDKYTKLTQDQKNNYTQSQINKGNYQSKKGDVLFRDEKAAQADFDNYLQSISSGKPSVPAQAISRPVANLQTWQSGNASPSLPHSSPSVQSTPAVTPMQNQPAIQRPIATPAVDTKDSRLNLLSKVAESQKKKLSGFSKLYE